MILSQTPSVHFSSLRFPTAFRRYRRLVSCFCTRSVLVTVVQHGEGGSKGGQEGRARCQEGREEGGKGGRYTKGRWICSGQFGRRRCGAHSNRLVSLLAIFVCHAWDNTGCLLDAYSMCDTLSCSVLIVRVILLIVLQFGGSDALCWATVWRVSTRIRYTSPALRDEARNGVY